MKKLTKKARFHEKVLSRYHVYNSVFATLPYDLIGLISYIYDKNMALADVYELLNNDKETGFTFILMNERLDEGDIILSQKLKINSTDNYQDLLNRIVDLASKELVTTIEKIFSNNIKLLPQDHNKATYCYRIKKEETYLNFVNTAQEVYGKIRALSPSPGAKFYLKGELIKAGFIVTKTKMGHKLVKQIDNKPKVYFIHETGGSRCFKKTTYFLCLFLTFIFIAIK